MGDRDGEEEMEIYFNPTHGFFKMGKSLTVIRLIDGEFPEYEQVVPKGNDKKLVMAKRRCQESKASLYDGQRKGGGSKIFSQKKFCGDVLLSSRLRRCKRGG